MTVSLPVRDLDAAAAWYHRVLGLEEVYRRQSAGWCELESPVTQVTLGLYLEMGERPTGGPAPAFRVQNLERARGVLEARGVRFRGESVTHPGWVKLASFLDPDGNSLMLLEDLREQPRRIEP